MSIAYHLHIFRSPGFQSVVNEAITFFDKTPVHPLSPSDSFIGTGVYALYYTGPYHLYSEIAKLNQKKLYAAYLCRKSCTAWMAYCESKTNRCTGSVSTLVRTCQKHPASGQSENRGVLLSIYDTQ